MRKTFFLFFCILVMGCEKENSEPEYTPVGTYRLISAGKSERIFPDESNETIRDIHTNLYNDCSKKSIITINSDGTFEKLDYKLDGENCESESKKGRWPNKPIIYNNNIGDFKIDNSSRVYEVFSKGINKTNNTVYKIDVTYGSIKNESGRYIYTYMRVD